jgi:hypothetical protein
VGCPGTGLRAEQSSLTAPQKSAEGIVGVRERAEGLNGGQEESSAVERGDGILRGVDSGIWDELAAGTAGNEAPVGVMAHPD